jgi:alginate O-acetyltransferase complex protein AlgI
MAFNSISYLLFLPFVYLSFYYCSKRWQWLVLLLGSYWFYASLQAYHLLVVLLVVTITSFTCGIRMAATSSETVRSRWLWGGVLVCVATLALGKFVPILQSLSHSKADATYMTVGISYFTFQAISYLADVYFNLEKPERSFGHYALYLAFFPKLLQGPLERAGDFLPQVKKTYVFDYKTVRSGMLLFSWGLLKKVVIADRLAMYSDLAFGNIGGYKGLLLLAGTYAYTLQIFFDFSGYTDMARGTARMFGFELMENFNRPYLSTSIAEFWRRWHISFSRWILDYVFKPLQFSWRNAGKHGTALALLVTFLLSGIWHGISWGFLAWGALHGLLLAASTYYRPYQKKLHNLLGVKKSSLLTCWQIFVTFNLVNITWIFFRARSISEALRMIFSLISSSGTADAKSLFLVDGYVGAAALILSLFVYYLLDDKVRSGQMFGYSFLGRWCAYVTILFGVLLFGAFHSSSEFIYYQF